ncbi:MAG: hypothetical protein M0R22_06310 [Dehalococcoidia bacterium]|nr:hypothetical protein [Dehalococcoidia bacterium]
MAMRTGLFPGTVVKGTGDVGLRAMVVATVLGALDGLGSVSERPVEDIRKLAAAALRTRFGKIWSCTVVRASEVAYVPLGNDVSMHIGGTDVHVMVRMSTHSPQHLLDSGVLQPRLLSAGPAITPAARKAALNAISSFTSRTTVAEFATTVVRAVTVADLGHSWAVSIYAHPVAWAVPQQTAYITVETLLFYCTLLRIN